ncbi:hypothetical protein [Streptomyces sp. RG80]|uniref:hypothetical protein n=1 Tax=Streptomyces sp. RG80 TaxID=3157340 RepID=UPI00338D4775
MTVPEPGMAVSVDMLTEDGATHGFTLEVATDDKVSYLLEGATADSSTEAEVDAAASPSACSDGAYKTDDRKEYGTYNWYIGDGGLPAGLSKTDAIWAFGDAIDNITDSYNNCGYSDTVGVKENYLATTSREASVNKSVRPTSVSTRTTRTSRTNRPAVARTGSSMCAPSVRTRPDMSSDSVMSGPGTRTSPCTRTCSGARRSPGPSARAMSWPCAVSTGQSPCRRR